MISLIATILLAATPAAPKLSAAPASPFALPAPASLKRDEVLAWTSKYVRGGDWMLLAYDYEGVKLIAPGGVRRTPEGLAEADVRTELFRPILLKVGVTARSGLAHWNVDCEAQRLAVLTMTVYAGNNLQGELANRTTEGKPWQDPVGSEAEAIKSVCRQIGK
jgi:hypothetical protein